MEREQLQRLGQEVMGSVGERDVSRWHSTLVTLFGVGYTEENARLLLEKKRAQAAKAQVVAQVAIAAQPKTEEQIEARVQEYLRAFVPETPNDMAMLRNLASVELQLDAVNRQIASIQEYDGTKKMTDLIKIQTDLSTTHRQFQTTLGIDRRTRDEQSGGSDVREQIEHTIQEAAEFYRRKVVVIHHCGIKLGHVLAHFTDWEMRIKCPVCGQTAHVTHLDMKEEPFVERVLPKEHPDD